MNNFISFDKWELPVFTLRVINDSNMMLFGDIGFKCPKNQGFGNNLVNIDYLMDGLRYGFHPRLMWYHE